MPERQRVICCIAVGHRIPNYHKRHDSVLTLNGILLGVIDVFPAIQSILVNGMKDSLEKGALAHIRDEDQCDLVSLRTMYFGAHMIFLSPLGDARRTALANFMTNTVYKINQSPVEFLDKTILKAKEVDKLFQSKQVTDGTLWTIVFEALEKTVGDYYNACVDRFRLEPGFDNQSRETLRGIFLVMDTKYKEKKRSADQPYAMVVHDGTMSPTDEFSVYRAYVAHFAGKGPSAAKGGGRFNKTPNSANPIAKQDLPCFAFQRNGK